MLLLRSGLKQKVNQRGVSVYLPLRMKILKLGNISRHVKNWKSVRIYVFIWWLSENLRKNKSRPQDSREYSKEMGLSCTAEHVNSELSTIFTGDPLCPWFPGTLPGVSSVPWTQQPGALCKVWEWRGAKGNDAKIFVSWRRRWNLPSLTLGWNEAEHHWTSLMQLSAKWRMEVKIKDSPRWLHICEVF